MVAICNSYLCKLCFVFDLNKNLTLKKDNLFSFSSLNRFFALSLDKIGCISTKKIKKRFFILFCLRFVLPLQRNINYIHGIIMEATVNNIQVNVMTVANAGVVKETTYQKLKRLSKKYNLQTNDPKFARV